MPVLSWVVGLSLLSAAAAMGVIAWRMARRARDRESARVELLRALAFPEASPVPASGPSISKVTTEYPAQEEIASAAPVDTYEEEAASAVDAYEPVPIFAERVERVAALPRWISLSGVGAVMALGVTLYVVLAGSPQAASATTKPARATLAPGAPEAVTTANVPTAALPNKPIELIALQYKPRSATAVEVSGLVFNPADGRALPKLVAVVSLLDADGRILSSKVMPVERPVLEGGQTSAFSLAFPRVTGTVARYQVGFHLDGGETIMHVDRHTSEPDAKAPSS